MKPLKILVFLSASILFLSCEKEKEQEQEFDIHQALEMFLASNALQFKGMVMDEDVYWVFSDWQNGIGAYTESFWCLTADKKIQQRNFAIYDYEEREEILSVKIKSPAFSIDSSYTWKKSIFDVGMKLIRNPEDGIFDGFDIEVSGRDGFFSTVYGDQSTGTLEVLRLEEAGAPEGDIDFKEVKVWFHFSCNLYRPNGAYAGQIEHGMLMGNFLIEFNGNVEAAHQGTGALEWLKS